MANRRARPLYLLIGALVVVIATTALVAMVTRGSQTPEVARDPHGVELPALRVVQLSTSMPAPSDMDGLHARLVRGTMPTTPTTATVLTDEECAPDAQGISHCLNRLRLDNGYEIDVRHPHDMGVVPCLAPGEIVQIEPPV